MPEPTAPDDTASDDFIPGCVAALRVSRAVLRDAVDRVPSDQRGRRPAAERWSVAEILEHLVLVETAVTRLLARASKAPVPDDAGPEVVPYERSQVLDRTLRAKAFEQILPAGRMSWEDAWEGLRVAREELVRVLEGADPGRLRSLRAPHFIFGMFDGEAWARFVADHEERHADQICEVAEGLKG